MKQRNGFVSNSSSTSFTCDVCGGEIVGHDMSHEEAGMYQFNCGHIMCVSHIEYDINTKITKKVVESHLSGNKYYKKELERIQAMSEEEFKKTLEECEFEFIEHSPEEPFDCGDMPSELCPICKMELFDQGMLVDYISKTTGFTKDDMFKIIKQNNKRRKKLRLQEYIEHVERENIVNMDELTKGIKERFATYDEFHKFVYGG